MTMPGAMQGGGAGDKTPAMKRTARAPRAIKVRSSDREYQSLWLLALTRAGQSILPAACCIYCPGLGPLHCATLLDMTADHQQDAGKDDEEDGEEEEEEEDGGQRGAPRKPAGRAARTRGDVTKVSLLVPGQAAPAWLLGTWFQGLCSSENAIRPVPASGQVGTRICGLLCRGLQSAAAVRRRPLPLRRLRRLPRMPRHRHPRWSPLLLLHPLMRLHPLQAPRLRLPPARQVLCRLWPPQLAHCSRHWARRGCRPWCSRPWVPAQALQTPRWW